jgi:hypothetical protein
LTEHPIGHARILDDRQKENAVDDDDLDAPAGVSNLWKDAKNDHTTNAIFRFAIRVTLHDKNKHLFEDPNKMVDILENQADAKEYIFQKEQGQVTGKIHYQGFLKVKTKIRIEQLIRNLRPVVHGIEIRAAMNEKALKRYCQKTETRVEGPWALPPSLLGSRA